MPVVSISVPTYNYGRFLRQCIESVQLQTFANWELIVCDDCSEDETREVALECVKGDARIRYVRNKVRLGMVPNLKRAAELARGRYIKMLCSDDWLTPTCLERMVDLMEAHPSVVLATTAETRTDESGLAIGQDFLFGEPVSIIPGQKMIDRMVCGEGFGGNSSFMIRADAYREVGGYDSGRLYLGDYDLAARLCRIGDYCHTDEPLFYGRMHGASSSSLDPKRLFDMIDLLEITRDFFSPRPFGSREWWRYERLIGSVTARGLLNTLIAHARGNHEYAQKSFWLMLSRGNLHAGMVYFPFHLFGRAARWHRSAIESRRRVKSLLNHQGRD